MKRNLIITGITGIIGISLLAGCADEKSPCSIDSAEKDSITLVASLGGNGDNGYNDLVLAGVIRFHNQHNDLKVSLLHPENIKEAEEIYQQWYEKTAGNKEKSMIIFASDDYRSLILDFQKELDANQRAVFFESEETNLPENVTTFRISRYGVSYLAGAMAAESKEAHVVAAFESGGIIGDAITGFRDGYLETGGEKFIIDYLADDERGYSLPNAAYTLAGSMENAFIYPLAGGSNNGIYKYSRDNMFTLQLVAGMDVDCSDYSTRVPFSVLVKIDNVIYSLLEQWQAEDALPEHIEYGIPDKETIELVVNPHFLERVTIFENYYGDDNYWYERYDKYKDIALQREREYSYEK